MGHASAFLLDKNRGRMLLCLSNVSLSGAVGGGLFWVGLCSCHMQLYVAAKFSSMMWSHNRRNQMQASQKK